jgi:hypothetical protein
MKLDPGIHIVMHSVLSSKPGVIDPDASTRVSIETIHTYNPHEGEPRDYNNPQFLTSQSSTWIIITNQVRIHS